MVDKISLQVHDYDNCGRYRIVLDCTATLEEVFEWKEKARRSVKLEWDKLPESARHIVYYAEMVDKQNCVWFAAVYMHGEAFDDSEFERIFWAEDIGYVGAFHKKD